MSPERGSSSDRTLREKNDDNVGHNDQSKDQEKDEEKSEEKIEKEKQDKEDDAEKKAGGGSPLPVGFWDPKLKKVRMEVIKKWCLTTLFLMTFILAVMSLYWGVLFRVPQNMKNLKVAVVSFDGRSAPYTNVEPVVGAAVIQATTKLQQGSSYNQLGWTIVDPAQFNYDPIAVRQAVYDEKYWAAIIVNNNATALLEQAVAQGNQSYDPLGAAQTVYIQAKDESTYSNYVVPMLNQFQTQVQSQFGQQWISRVLSNPAYSANTYNQAPQALNPAIGFSVFNLRPFQPATATPAVSIGLIYLIIISFFSFSFYLPIHSKFIMPQGHPPMHFWEMCLWRIFATLLAYFFLSLAYSLVSLAFQIPFSNTFYHNDVTVAVAPDAYGRGSFVVYWMVNWLGMIALGLSSENVTMIIGQPWTALWLIFWVISNVSTSFYSEALSPAFFNWGYAWPLYHVVMASRTIIFDIHSKIGLNIGVLIAWSALNIALFFPCCVFMRWKTSKEMARKVPRSTIRYLVDG